MTICIFYDLGRTKRETGDADELNISDDLVLTPREKVVKALKWAKVFNVTVIVCHLLFLTLLRLLLLLAR